MSRRGIQNRFQNPYRAPLDRSVYVGMKKRSFKCVKIRKFEKNLQAIDFIRTLEDDTFSTYQRFVCSSVSAVTTSIQHRVEKKKTGRIGSDPVYTIDIDHRYIKYTSMGIYNGYTIEQIMLHTVGV